jgi:hypothetical protein
MEKEDAEIDNLYFVSGGVGQPMLFIPEWKCCTI